MFCAPPPTLAYSAYSLIHTGRAKIHVNGMAWMLSSRSQQNREPEASASIQPPNSTLEKLMLHTLDTLF